MTKTITISDEAYEALDGTRIHDLINDTYESDDELIKRLVERFNTDNEN